MIKHIISLYSPNKANIGRPTDISYSWVSQSRISFESCVGNKKQKHEAIKELKIINGDIFNLLSIINSWTSMVVCIWEDNHDFVVRKPPAAAAAAKW